MNEQIQPSSVSPAIYILTCVDIDFATVFTLTLFRVLGFILLVLWCLFL